MAFKKWCSIENSYRQKHIDWYLERFPELLDDTYVITEKIHGSNFQWYLEPDKPVVAGSRNMYLEIDGSFQGAYIPELLDADKKLLDFLQARVNRDGCTYRVFGELFGKGIGKGVDYGEEKRLLYFGMMVDDVLVPFTTMEMYIPRSRMVPVVGIIDGLANAMQFDTAFNSCLSDKDNNLCEGVVIQPYRKVYQVGDYSPFMLKKKNRTFEEKMNIKAPVVIAPEVKQLKAEFAAHITDNRLQSVFSKHGEIEKPSQIGNYIRLVLEDARIDFMKDHKELFDEMTPKQQKNILNVGGQIANMLKAYM